MGNNPAVQKLVNVWREIYKSDNPLEALKKVDGEFPPILKIEMEDSHFILPEPFYGPFEQDMRNDLLVLLMNPGEVKQSEVYSPNINAATKDRYTTWQRRDFLQECGRLDKKKITIPRKTNICDKSCVLHDLSWDGCRWRRTRYREAKFDVGLSFDLLNTMEYIPYHSKRFGDLDESIQEWLFFANTTKMAFDAICEIANNHLVKHIVGLGSSWIKVFETYGYSPVENIPFKNSKGDSLGRLVKFQINESALPIVIHLYPGAIKFPTQKNIINEMRRMLDLPIL